MTDPMFVNLNTSEYYKILLEAVPIHIDLMTVMTRPNEVIMGTDSL